jgi:hypothetical protein
MRRRGDSRRLKPDPGSYWVAYAIVLLVGAGLMALALI